MAACQRCVDTCTVTVCLAEKKVFLKIVSESLLLFFPYGCCDVTLAHGWKNHQSFCIVSEEIDQTVCVSIFLYFHKEFLFKASEILGCVVSTNKNKCLFTFSMFWTVS